MKKSFKAGLILCIVSIAFEFGCKKDSDPPCEDHTNEFVGNYSGEETEPGNWSVWNFEITKSNNSKDIVISCFPNLCLTIEGSVCNYELFIPETTFSNIPATSHGGTVFEYYYDEIISGSGVLTGNNLQIDYNRKQRKTGDTLIYYQTNGHINVTKH